MSSDSADEVWIVRHGETEWSKTLKHTSYTDVELTEVGESVARGLVDRLPRDFDRVLCSPMLRARRTAELAGFADVEIDPDLVEWNYGQYEGVTTAEIRESVPGWTTWSHPSPGGESPGQVTLRCDRVIAKLRAQGGKTLVFGHGHSLRALTARWLGLVATDGRLFRLDTATVSVLSYERENPVIARWNA